MQCIWKPEDNLQEGSGPLRHMGPRMLLCLSVLRARTFAAEPSPHLHIFDSPHSVTHHPLSSQPVHHFQGTFHYVVCLGMVVLLSVILWGFTGITSHSNSG